MSLCLLFPSLFPLVDIACKWNQNTWSFVAGFFSLSICFQCVFMFNTYQYFISLCCHLWIYHVLSFSQLIFELFPLLALTDKDAMNNHVQLFVGTCIFIFLRCIPKSRIVESYDNLRFNFWRSYQTFFQSDYTIIHITRGKIAGSYSTFMFNVLRNYQTFPEWLYHFSSPPTMYEGSNFSISNTRMLFLF